MVGEEGLGDVNLDLIGVEGAEGGLRIQHRLVQLLGEGGDGLAREDGEQLLDGVEGGSHAHLNVHIVVINGDVLQEGGVVVGVKPLPRRATLGVVAHNPLHATEVLAAALRNLILEGLGVLGVPPKLLLIIGVAARPVGVGKPELLPAGDESQLLLLDVRHVPQHLVADGLRVGAVLGEGAEGILEVDLLAGDALVDVLAGALLGRHLTIVLLREVVEAVALKVLEENA